MPDFKVKSTLLRGRASNTEVPPSQRRPGHTGCGPGPHRDQAARWPVPRRAGRGVPDPVQSALLRRINPGGFALKLVLCFLLVNPGLQIQQLTNF